MLIILNDPFNQQTHRERRRSWTQAQTPSVKSSALLKWWEQFVIIGSFSIFTPCRRNGMLNSWNQISRICRYSTCETRELERDHNQAKSLITLHGNNLHLNFELLLLSQIDAYARHKRICVNKFNKRRPDLLYYVEKREIAIRYEICFCRHVSLSV